VGVIIGATIAHSLPQEKLRVAIAVSIIGVGVFIIDRFVV
jgi:uncharacterized membrane protein YfcA